MNYQDTVGTERTDDHRPENARHQQLASSQTGAASGMEYGVHATYPVVSVRHTPSSSGHTVVHLP
jgi:hypothetical protein